MVYKSLTVSFSNSFFNRNLFECPTNNMCSKVVANLFYLPNVVIKLHLDGKLQITLVYYLYHKRDFI